MIKLVAKGATTLALLSLSALPVLAQDTEAAPAVSPEVAYIFNTLLFLIGGFPGDVDGRRLCHAGSRPGPLQERFDAVLKNISLYSIAGLMFWITGYNLMYSGVDGGFIGSFGPYAFDPVGGDALDTGYSTASDWFFQMVFCATTASIVSGTLAERIKLWPFLIFTVVLTGFIYPIAGSWQWGARLARPKWASPTSPVRRWCTRSVAGPLSPVPLSWAPRKGKYGAGKVTPMPGSSMPLATLGTFILWLGWFGFNGASQLAMGTIGDVSDISRIFANTNMAAAAGVVAAMILTQILYKKVDVTMALNGALAGLVSITAEPLAPSVWQAVSSSVPSAA
jgi:Amt family ammonium transporter